MIAVPAAACKALSLLADQLINTRKKMEDLTADIRADTMAGACSVKYKITFAKLPLAREMTITERLLTISLRLQAWPSQFYQTK